VTSLGLDRQVVDRETYRRTVDRFRAAGICLPTFAQLTTPGSVPARILAALGEVPADAADPRNLFRVHWYNDRGRTGQADTPVHAVLPGELTGVAARIVVVPGDLFPMIRAHKVLAAYGCLAPRIITGAFDPTRDRAVWPSTGNYCRGGVAISRLMGCRGVAVLPEGMSRERFAWLEEWVPDPADIIRTPAATGILDDETYDWRAVVEGMLVTGGRPLVVSESSLAEANRLAVATTGIPVDPTGSSGLGGLLEMRRSGEIGDRDRVAVLFTGLQR
jgi:cysteine synthase